MIKTSVIMPAYIRTVISCHLTMLAIANITKYTDTEDYEFILIEDNPALKEDGAIAFPVRDDYHVLKIDEHVILPNYTNYSTKMNIAAREYAHYDNLVFIQNDVFVWEGWLKDMRYYIEHDLADCVIPQQFPQSRKYILDSYKDTMEEGMMKGDRDACMSMITREAFERIGGFNEDLEAFVEADYYEKMNAKDVRMCWPNKIHISHLTLGTHYQDMEAFEKHIRHDSLIRNHN